MSLLFFRKFFFMCVVFIMSNMILTAQVTGVKYLLEYNHETQEFDIFLYIVSGSATTIARRTQANAQITLVVPTNSTVTILRSYMPLIGNQTYTGTQPSPWTITNSMFSPIITPDYNYHSVTPNLSKASQYNNLFPGDTIKLFSFQITIESGCFDDIRLFINQTDPGASAPGMEGGDYRNGFVIGSIIQSYQGNLTSFYPDIAGGNFYLNIGQSKILSTSHGGNGIWTLWTNQPGLLLEDLGPGIARVTALPNATGTYILRYQDDDFTDFVCVSINDLQLQLLGNPFTCNGVPAQITAHLPQQASYLWSNGTTGNILLTTLPGLYTVSATLGSGYHMTASIDIQTTASMFLAADTLCILQSIELPDIYPGTWNSLNPDIISIENNQTALGHAAGTTRLSFTFENTSCIVYSGLFFVSDKPLVKVAGDTSICEKEMVRVIPTNGGQWVSHQPWIASVTDQGEVTGVSQGLASLVFEDLQSGCFSDTIYIKVLPKPFVKNLGADTLCLLHTTNLFPSTGGAWTAFQPEIADVTPAGFVSSYLPGTAMFEFYSDTMACPNHIRITVDKIEPSLTYVVLIVGNLIGLSHSLEGVWSSDNPDVINIINNHSARINIAAPTALRFAAFTGCKATFPIDFVLSKSISDNISDPELLNKLKEDDDLLSYNFKIFPNPVKDFIHLPEYSDEVQVVIFNTSGQKVYQSSEPNKTIDVSSLMPGSYIISLQSGNVWTHRPFIVE